jgi:peptidoglycan hydrolase CwlO-like protein
MIFRRITFFICIAFFVIEQLAEAQCQRCDQEVQVLEARVKDLEKLVRSLHEQIAKYMNLYSKEIDNKIASAEKNISSTIDYSIKFIGLENKFTALANSAAKKAHSCNC